MATADETVRQLRNNLETKLDFPKYCGNDSLMFGLHLNQYDQT